MTINLQPSNTPVMDQAIVADALDIIHNIVSQLENEGYDEPAISLMNDLEACSTVADYLMVRDEAEDMADAFI